MVNITHVDLLALAANFPFAQEINSIATTTSTTEHMTFVSYNDIFANEILGIDATEQLIADLSWDAFHEAVSQ